MSSHNPTLRNKKSRLKNFLSRIRPKRRLKFTRPGKFFVGITLLVGIGAINTGNNLLYLLMGMMLSQIILSGFLSDTVLLRLKVRPSLPSDIYARTPARLGVVLTNRKRFATSFNINVHYKIPGTEAPSPIPFISLNAGEHREETTDFTFSRRGEYRVSGLTMTTLFPFGLFLKSQETLWDKPFLVLPHLHEVRHPPEQQGDQLGEQSRNIHGFGNEYFGLRELQQGEDHRHVHWKSSAKRGKLMVKEYEREDKNSVQLNLINARETEVDDNYEEELEEIISMTASLAAHYLSQGFGVTLNTINTSVAEGYGPVQLRRILYVLATLPFLDESSSGNLTPLISTGSVLVIHKQTAERIRLFPSGDTVIIPRQRQS